MQLLSYMKSKKAKSYLDERKVGAGYNIEMFNHFLIKKGRTYTVEETTELKQTEENQIPVWQ